MKLLLIIVVFFTTTTCFSQFVQLGTTDTLCEGEQTGIIGTSLDSSNLIIMDNPTYLNLGNLGFSPLINIGFDFTFYDSIYNQLAIGSNGVVSFNTYDAEGDCPFVVNPMPNAFVFNSILMPWANMNPAANTISYQIIGEAPNRSFLVYFNNPGIGEAVEKCWSTSVILHETTNEIEIHTKNYNFCESCILNHAIQGIQGQYGSYHIVPGRDYQDEWSVIQDGKRWTPDGPQSYSISDVPFKVFLDSTFSLGWGNTLGDFFPLSDTLTVTGNNSGNIGYYMGVRNDNYCSEMVISLTDTSWINMDYTSPDLIVAGDFCNAGIGAIISTTSPATNSAYFWSDQNVFSDSLINLIPGLYPFVYTGNNGCQLQDTITILASDTLTYVFEKVNCLQNDLGSISIIAPQSAIDFEWVNYPANASNELLNLYAGVYTCYASSSLGCFDTISMEIGFKDSLDITFESITHQTCFGHNNGDCLFDEHPNEPLDILLNGSPQIGLHFMNLAPGIYTLFVNDNVGCSFTDTFEINVAPLLELTVNTTPVTSGDNGTIELIGNGGFPPYTYYVYPQSQTTGIFDSLESGTYNCAIMDLYGCMALETVDITSIISIKEMNENLVQVFPNPVRDHLTIEVSQESTPQQISFTSLSGETINLQSTFENYQIKVDMSDLPQGMYLMKIVVESEEQVIPIMKI